MRSVIYLRESSVKYLRLGVIVNDFIYEIHAEEQLMEEFTCKVCTLVNIEQVAVVVRRRALELDFK